MLSCVINHSSCTPRPCVHCGRIFCPHEHPERRSFGSYGQYCTRECGDEHAHQVFALGRERFQASRVVLLVEREYCYLVLNKQGRYGFRIFIEEATSLTSPLSLSYCHYPFLSPDSHPVTLALSPRLHVAMMIYNESTGSMWTIVGFEVFDGHVQTYGVGGRLK